MKFLCLFKCDLFLSLCLLLFLRLCSLRSAWRRLSFWLSVFSRTHWSFLSLLLLFLQSHLILHHHLLHCSYLLRVYFLFFLLQLVILLSKVTSFCFNIDDRFLSLIRLFIIFLFFILVITLIIYFNLSLWLLLMNLLSLLLLWWTWSLILIFFVISISFLLS